MGLVGQVKGYLNKRTPLPANVMKTAIPVRNPFATIVEETDEVTILEAPLAETSRGFMALLAKSPKAPKTKRFELEAVGAFVWQLCDGKNTFEGISRQLLEKYKMQRVEADASLAAFLQMLAQRKLITLMVKGQK
jgi:hypothetical protein